MWTQLSPFRRLPAAAAAAAFVVFVASPLHADGQAPGRANTPAKTDQRAPGQNPVKDGWITFKIHSAFVPDAALEGSDIDVTTKAGVVTLAGTVPSAAGRTRAVAIAKETDGVKSVTDSLRVAPAAGASVDTSGAKNTARAAGRSVNDGWIKSKIYAQFLTDWSVFEDSDIDIDVTGGAVALNGTVRSQAAKTRAVALSKATDGVKTVKDNLTVRAN
jgi:hyperosmotically inducible periplasmic protein